MEDNQSERKARLQELASQLLFDLKNEGSRFAPAYTTAAVFSAGGDGARPQPEHNTRRTIPLIAPRLPRCQRGRLLVRRFPTLAAQSVRPHR